MMRNSKEQKPLVLKQPLSIQRVVISFEDRKKKNLDGSPNSAPDSAKLPLTGQSSPDSVSLSSGINKEAVNHAIVTQIKTPRIEDAIASKISSLSLINSPTLDSSSPSPHKNNIPTSGTRRGGMSKQAINFKIQQAQSSWGGGGNMNSGTNSNMSSPHASSILSSSINNQHVDEEITSASSWDENDYSLNVNNVSGTAELPISFVSKIQIRSITPQAAVQQKKKAIEKLFSNVSKQQFWEDHEEPITYVSPQIARPRPQSAIKTKPGVRTGQGVSVNLNPRFCASYKKYQWDYRALVDTLIEVKMEEREKGIPQPDPAEMAKLQLQQRQEREFAKENALSAGTDQQSNFSHFVISGVHPPANQIPKQPYLKKMNEGKRRRRSEVARDFINQEKLFSKNYDPTSLDRKGSSFLPLSRPLSAVSRLQSNSSSNSFQFPARENPKRLQFTGVAPHHKFCASGGFTARAQPVAARAPSPRIDRHNSSSKLFGSNRPQSANPRLSNNFNKDSLNLNFSESFDLNSKFLQNCVSPTKDEDLTKMDGNSLNLNAKDSENDEMERKEGVETGVGIEIDTPNSPATPATDRNPPNSKTEPNPAEKEQNLQNPVPNSGASSPLRAGSPAPVSGLTIKRKESLTAENETSRTVFVKNNNVSKAKPQQRYSKGQPFNRAINPKFPPRPASATSRIEKEKIAAIGKVATSSVVTKLIDSSALNESELNSSIANFSVSMSESLDAEVENVNSNVNNLNLSTDSSAGLEKQALHESNSSLNLQNQRFVTFKLDDENHPEKGQENSKQPDLSISGHSASNSLQPGKVPSKSTNNTFFQAFRKPSSPVPPDQPLKTKEQTRNSYGNAQQQKMLSNLMKKKF